MNAAEHRELAELYLEKLNKDSCRFDALWSQAMATAALAHATLAASEPRVRVDPGVSPVTGKPLTFDLATDLGLREGGNLDEVPGADELREKIVFQGSAVAKRVECERLEREEYTKRHAAELLERLAGSVEPPGH